MPVSSDDATGLTKNILAIYTDAEEQLLAIIAARIAKGIDEPNWADRLLIQIQGLRGDTAKLLAVLEQQGLIAYQQMVQLGYNAGTALAGADLTAAGAAAGAFGVVDQDAVKALAKEGQKVVKAVGNQLKAAAPRIFRDVTLRVAAMTVTGVLTRRQAAAQAMQVFAGAGITGFKDDSGRNWDLASYVEMATRTAAAAATVQGHTDRLQSVGQDLVIVSTAPESCPYCGEFEGRVLSLSGKTPNGSQTKNGQRFTVVASLAQAKRKKFMHPNCRHRLGIFLPGFTEPPDHPAHDVEKYKERQGERAREVIVRQHKRRVLAAEAFGKNTPEAKQARAKLKAAQQRLTEYRFEHDRRQGKNNNRTSLTSR